MYKYHHRKEGSNVKEWEEYGRWKEEGKQGKKEWRGGKIGRREKEREKGGI